MNVPRRPSMAYAGQPGQPPHVLQQPPMSASKLHRRKKTVERELPHGFELVVPESRLYTELAALEKRLDTLVMRKRLDIQEALSRPIKQRRVLRLFLSNTAVNQPDADGMVEDNPACIPAWTLKIEGKLLDDPNKSTAKTRKFSHFLRKIVVDIQRDPELYTENNIAEWNKVHNQPEIDGFEIKRKGDEDVECKIHLYLDHQPEKYQLNPELENILNFKYGTKPGVIFALWQYIKSNNLQDSSDSRVIRTTPELQQLFNVQSFQFVQLPELISAHLSPMPPIEIPYVVRVLDWQNHRVAFDIDVEMDDGNKAQMAAFVSNAGMQKEIAHLDQQISTLIQKLQQSRLKRDFMQSFASDPANFINRWVASQSRDLETILGENQVNLEAQRLSDFFKQPWIAEAAFHYAHSKIQTTTRM